MRLRPGRLRDMVEDCRRHDKHIPCHEFLTLEHGQWVWGPQAQGAVCRGYWEVVPHSWLLRFAERLRMIEYIDPPPTAPSSPGRR